MAGKKKPSAAPDPRDDSVYRVKHISRSAWEDGTLSLPGIAPKAAREADPEFDDVAMDMAMTGEIPLELIRSMLRQQEEQAEKKKPGKEKAPPPGGMILPEEIVARAAAGAVKAETAMELPTLEEIEAAKNELRAMRDRSRLPQPEKTESPGEELKKQKGRKKERARMQEKETDGDTAEKPAEPAQPAALNKQAPAEEQESGGPPSLIRTFGLLPCMRAGAPGRWDDDVPLYHIPAGRLLRAAYRSLYYYGLRFVRPLRIIWRIVFPHLAKPLLTLWYMLRAAMIALHHISVGRVRRAFHAVQEVHARRLGVRKGRVKLRTALRGILIDYRPVLRPAANAAMPLAAVVVLLIVIHSVTGFQYALQVDFNGSTLGYIDNESVFLQARAAANRHIAPLPETAEDDEAVEAPPDAGQTPYAQFNIARVRPEQFTSVDILTDQLLDNSPLDMTSACGIWIDGELFAPIKNSTDADSVLTSIKNTKSATLQVGENATVGFVQKVDLQQGFYPTDQLVDAQTLLRRLTQPQREEITVAIQAGDNLDDLRGRYGVSTSELYALNPDLAGNERKLMPGDTLLMKAEVSTLEVKIVQTETRTEDVPYETVDAINSSLYKGEVRVRVKGEPGQERITERITYINGMRDGEPEEINRARVKEPITERRELGSKSAVVTNPSTGQTTVVNVNATGFTWPVPDCHRVSSGYGYRGRSFHRGIDIADGNTNGKIIVAAKAGVVEQVQLGGSSYGNMILINHGGGVKTRYAHLMSGSISVRQGESVGLGQPIGRVGATGNSTGPHLHFEVIINGGTQNPLNYVRA